MTNDQFGNAGNAYLFNGYSDYVEISQVPQTSLDSITISCWLRTASLDQMGMAISYGKDTGWAPADGIQFGITHDLQSCVSDSGNQISFIHAAIGCGSGNYFFQDTTTWHLVTLEHKNNTTKIFIDTSLVLTQTMSTLSPVTSFRIGSATGIRFFNGDIDEVGVWNRPLTPTELLTLYTSSGVGMYQISTEKSISVHPNPATDAIEVGVNSSSIGSLYSIVDKLGQTVLNGTITSESMRIEIGSLSNGVYILRAGDLSSPGIMVIKQ